MSDLPYSSDKHPQQTEEEADPLIPDSVPIMIGLTVSIDNGTVAGSNVRYTVSKAQGNLGTLRVFFASYPNHNFYPPVCEQETQLASNSNSMTFTHTPVYMGWPYRGLLSIIVIEVDAQGNMRSGLGATTI